MHMRENHPGNRETVRKHWQTINRREEDLYVKTLKRWERIYLEEGEQGLMTEQCGRKTQADRERSLWIRGLRTI